MAASWRTICPTRSPRHEASSIGSVSRLSAPYSRPPGKTERLSPPSISLRIARSPGVHSGRRNASPNCVSLLSAQVVNVILTSWMGR
eukprot:3699539-Pleurochrysis_carterae.AAC.2